MDSAFAVHPRAWLGVPEMLTRPAPLAYESIPHPILVAHGEHDQVLPIDRSRELAERLPNGRFVEISGRGHCTNLEDPTRFTQIADAFLFH